MLAIDLSLDSSTAITAGTSNARTASLLGGNDPKSSVRSVAAVALTAPENLRISHTVRTAKGFRTAANASVPASDVLFDRHLVRLDKNVTQSTHLDPEFRINRSIQLVIESPRLGASTPTAAQLADDLLSIVSMLRAGTNANLIRVLNLEV